MATATVTDQVHCDQNPVRTVKCNRCGHVFGIDARLGVSEVASCCQCVNNSSKIKEEKDYEREEFIAE